MRAAGSAMLCSVVSAHRTENTAAVTKAPAVCLAHTCGSEAWQGLQVFFRNFIPTVSAWKRNGRSPPQEFLGPIY